MIILQIIFMTIVIFFLVLISIRLLRAVDLLMLKINKSDQNHLMLRQLILDIKKDKLRKG